MLKQLAVIAAITLIQACSHPLKIVGEGDIVETLGSNRGCTLEQFQGEEKTCTRNLFVGEFDVSYLPVARKGWSFDGWDGYCLPDSDPPACNLRANKDLVRDSWFKTMPPLTAVFTFQGPWFPDEDGDEYGDEFDEGVYGNQPDPSYVTDFSDCNDGNPNINPGATESTSADLIDSNCDGEVDPGYKYAFLAERYDGNLGGLAGADAKCQAEADNAEIPLPGNYFAYLSTSTLDARNRLSIPQGEDTNKFVLVDGSTIAGCWPCFYDDGFLFQGRPLNRDENGDVVDIPFEADYVWTGSSDGGFKRSGPLCNDWTSSSASLQSTVGHYTGLNDSDEPGAFQQGGGYECNVPWRLYCLQK